VDQPGKGFGFFREFLGGLTGLERLLGVGASILAPPEMKEDTDEHQGDRQEFVKQEVWDHDGALSHGDEMSPSYVVLASLRSAVSNPSLNHPDIG
jgi:hypothetical protein